jgi:hypothetical protein
MADPNIPNVDPALMNSFQTMKEQSTQVANNMKQAVGALSTMADEMEDFAGETTNYLKQLGQIQTYGQGLAKADKAHLEAVRRQLESQRGMVSVTKQLSDINKANLAINKQQIDNLREQGKYIRANMKEWSQGFRNPETGKFSAGSTSQKVMETAQNPQAQLENLGGPWGMLIKFIIDTIDGIRKLRSELQAADAASGNFVKGMGEASKAAMNLKQSQMEFATQGLDVEQVADMYKALKATGIDALGAISPTVGKLSEMADAVNIFSKATGEGYDAVAGRFADFIRNFGIAKSDVKAKYFEILKTAEAVGQKGIMTTSKYMQSVMSLADAFKDVGVNVTDVNKVLSTVSTTMVKMGRPAENIQKVAQGIMGISKAGEGWKVFMAKMSGVQGGYAQSLFAAEQRGAGFDLTKAGKQDVGKMIAMARAAILQPTAGIGDTATRRLMIERMGSQFGMDAETTQVFQKLSEGAISQEQAAGSIEKLREAAQKYNLDSKGMFDIIRNILTGLIAKPIIMIYRILSNWKGSAADKKMAGDMDKAINKGAAGGAYIKSGGMLRVHANEVVGGGMVVPAAQTRSLTTADLRRGGQGSFNINVNVNMDGNTLHKAFQEAESKTVAMIRKQQKANFGG